MANALPVIGGQGTGNSTQNPQPTGSVTSLGNTIENLQNQPATNSLNTSTFSGTIPLVPASSDLVASVSQPVNNHIQKHHVKVALWITPALLIIVAAVMTIYIHRSGKILQRIKA